MIMLPDAPRSAWEKSSFIAWISLLVTVIILAVAVGRAFERLSTTVENINNAVTFDEKALEVLRADLKKHHEDSNSHFSARDAADFQTMKSQLNAIGQEQGTIVRTLSSIDKRMRINR